MDKRIVKLAELIVNYSLKIKPGEKVFLDSSSEVEPFIEEFYKQILKRKAFPVSNIFTKNYHKILFENSSDNQLNIFPKHLLNAAKECSAIIDIENQSSDLSSVNPKKRAAYMRTMKPYWDFLIYQRGNMRRATILLPGKKEAELAGMSEKEFANIIYSSSLLNWKALAKKFNHINKIIEKGKEVHLIGEGVDLRLSIAGRNSILEDGHENVPGGEIYMAPLKKSLEGWIRFDFPAHLDGIAMGGIYLKFKKGKVVEFNATHGKKELAALLNTDAGAKYVGEFAFGINPKVKKATCSWVDEKMDGTIHLALGQCYEENKGDNNSAIHFDFVKDMHKGKIILDGKVIQDKGKWLI